MRDNEEKKYNHEIVLRKRTSSPNVSIPTSEGLRQHNATGTGVVELMKIEDCTLTVKGFETTEGSPIICIKPYISRVDSIPDSRVPELTSLGHPTQLR